MEFGAEGGVKMVDNLDGTRKRFVYMKLFV